MNWTRKHLSPADRQWLRDLKYVRMVTNFTIVHATLDAPQRWGYVFDKLAAAASFPYQNTQVCFFGHTHVPVAFIRDGLVRGGLRSTARYGELMVRREEQPWQSRATLLVDTREAAANDDLAATVVRRYPAVRVPVTFTFAVTPVSVRGLAVEPSLQLTKR